MSQAETQPWRVESTAGIAAPVLVTIPRHTMDSLSPLVQTWLQWDQVNRFLILQLSDRTDISIGSHNPCGNSPPTGYQCSR